MKFHCLHIYIILIITLFSSFPLGAKVTGSVMDIGGEPIVGATVIWEGYKTGTITDGEGSFSIALPNNEGHNLIVKFIGCESDTTFVTNPDEEIYVILHSNAELSEVSVNGYQNTTMKSRVGLLNTDNIGSGELLRAACCNLGESFTTNPSVDVSYADAATGAKQIRLLGLSGKYVQMMAENIPNYRGVAMPYALGYIPGPWMQSIQVSKGASSVKNGYESITGQINVEFKKPQLEDQVSANVFANSMGKFEANVDGNIHLNKKLSTGLLLHYENLFPTHDSDHDNFMDTPRVEQFNIFNRWAHFSDRNIFQGGVKYLHENRIGGQTNKIPETERYTIGIKTDFVDFFAKNAIFTNKAKNGNVAIILNANYQKFDSHYGIKSYLNNQWHVYTSLLYETDFDEHNSISAGLSLNYDNLAQTYGEQNVQKVNEKETVPGAYVQYTYKLGEKFAAMAGIRLDHSSLYGAFVTPRAHIKWTPNNILNLRMSAGKGYRTVHVLAENNYLFANSRKFIINNTEQESGWNVGTSAALYIPLFGKTLNVNLEYYYTKFLHQVVADFDSNPAAVTFDCLHGKSYSHCFQAEANYMLFRGFNITAAYRLTDSKCTFGGVLLEQPLTNRYKTLVSLSYKTPLELWMFDATLQVNGGGRMPTPYMNPDATMSWSERFPTYCQLNVQVTRFFRHWSIYLGGENLTNYMQKNRIIDSANPWGDKFDSTLTWGPAHGIVIYAGVRLNFKK